MLTSGWRGDWGLAAVDERIERFEFFTHRVVLNLELNHAGGEIHFYHFFGLKFSFQVALVVTGVRLGASGIGSGSGFNGDGFECFLLLRR